MPAANLGQLITAAEDGEPIAILHIGTHRTGTTSFQGWAFSHGHELSRLTALDYYDGLFGPSHFEIPLLCLRTNRNMPMRAKHLDWCLDEWQQMARAHVRNQVERPSHALLASAEAFSYLRHRDEIERVIELLHPRQIAVVVVLRERSSFLRSYREWLAEVGIPASPYHESFAYVADDSWLADYAALLGAWRRTLGADRVVEVDYEETLRRSGSVIPGILAACGADPSETPQSDGFWYNGPARRRVIGRVRRLLAS